MANRIRELAGHRLAVGNPTGSLPTKRTATWAVLNEVLQRRRSNAAPDDVECRPWHLKIAEHDTAAPEGGGERDGVDQRHVRTHDMWQTLRIITGPAGAVTNRQPRRGGENIEKRRWNKQVQGFELVLDFSQSRASARLSYGSYVIVGDCSGSECITAELGSLVLRFQQHEHRQ